MIKNILIVGLSIFLLSLSVANAEQFDYNMTKQDKKESIILEMCIAEIELAECEMLYGGGTGDGKLE